MTTYTAAELRELDKRVGIEIMGYKYFRPKSYSSYTNPTGLAYLMDSARYGNDPGWMVAEDNWPRETECRRLPFFTTDPAAFMVLLNHLRSDPAIEVDFTTAADYSRCTIRPSDNAKLVKHWASSGKGMGGNAPNIMIALTLAAIAACEEEGKTDG